MDSRAGPLRSRPVHAHRLPLSVLALCLLLGPSARAAEPASTPLTFSAAGRACSALLTRPEGARAFFVLGHGANMDMRTPFMAALAEALARQNVATLRFNFPYADAGRSEPDPPGVLVATVRAAVAEGARRRGALPLVVGGKSLSTLVLVKVLADDPPAVAGAVMLGYPLHAPGRPSVRNAVGLDAIGVPLLFVQGTRDPLAALSLLRPVVQRLGPHARLHVVEGGDHQFELEADSYRVGRPPVIEEIAGAIAGFAATLPPAQGGD